MRNKNVDTNNDNNNDNNNDDHNNDHNNNNDNKVRVVLGHVRTKFDSTTESYDGKLKHLFEIMKSNPDEAPPPKKRQRHQQRMRTRPNPFVCFRESESNDDNLEEDPKGDDEVAYPDDDNCSIRIRMVLVCKLLFLLVLWLSSCTMLSHKKVTSRPRSRGTRPCSTSTFSTPTKS